MIKGNELNQILDGIIKYIKAKDIHCYDAYLCEQIGFVKENDPVEYFLLYLDEKKQYIFCRGIDYSEEAPEEEEEIDEDEVYEFEHFVIKEAKFNYNGNEIESIEIISDKDEKIKFEPYYIGPYNDFESKTTVRSIDDNEYSIIRKQSDRSEYILNLDPDHDEEW